MLPGMQGGRKVKSAKEKYNQKLWRNDKDVKTSNERLFNYFSCVLSYA